MRRRRGAPRPKHDDYAGLIAFIMAVGVAVGFAGALLLSASSSTPPIREETATLLSTLGGAMIGAIAAYLGMSKQPYERGPDDRDDERRDD